MDQEQGELNEPPHDSSHRVSGVEQLMAVRDQRRQPAEDAWRTAAVMKLGEVRAFVGRLRHVGIDHMIEQEGHEYRVRVRRSDLEESLDLKGSADRIGTRISSASSKSILRILLTIPAGALLGIGLSMFVLPASSFSRVLPPLTAILAVMIVEAIWHSNQPRESAD